MNSLSRCERPGSNTKLQDVDPVNDDASKNDDTRTGRNFQRLRRREGCCLMDRSTCVVTALRQPC